MCKCLHYISSFHPQRALRASSFKDLSLVPSRFTVYPSSPLIYKQVSMLDAESPFHICEIWKVPRALCGLRLLPGVNV